MRLIFLTFALVLFMFAAMPWAEPYRIRIIAAGLALMVAASYPLP